MGLFGNKGRFSERLKKILISKRKKNTNDEMRVEDSDVIYANYLKVMAAIPGFVYGNLKFDNRKGKQDNVVIAKNNEVDDASSMVKDINRPYVLDKSDNVSFDKEESKPVGVVDERSGPQDKDIRLENRKKISAIDIEKIKREQESIKTSEDKITAVSNDKDAHELEKSIINIIKKKLIKTVNELEILQSELYILSEVNGESKVLVECQRELDQVKNILCRIDKLKEQYDFLKDNYDFEYLLEIDDNNLVDKIIELRDAFGKKELKIVAEDYKLLDVYRYLYLKIDDLNEKTVEFEKTKKAEVQKLKERDIDFEKLKHDVYNMDAVNLNYSQFVNNQNELLREIDEKVSKISSYEQVSYHMKGFGRLFFNTFKYFGLLMLSPLKGIIPSIATETLITSNLIKNLYQNLEWEETRKMVYEAIDYSNLINNAISDLESTNRIVDMTLDELVHLKMQYNEKFKKYHGDFSEYRDVMRKISDMENKILGNKIKIEMMRQRALEQQRENTKKLILVRELNEKENQQ